MYLLVRHNKLVVHAVYNIKPLLVAIFLFINYYTALKAHCL